MSAQVTIGQLPTAGAITGSELVPVVQNGVTVQTTTGAIAGSPTQTYTYLTVTQTPQLANSRYFGAVNGLTITDGGAQGPFNVGTTGALLSLVNAGTGFQVKTDATAITPRSIAVSGTGLSISNGSGVSGDPTISLTGQTLNFANASFNGLVVLSTAGAITSATITGTSNQIAVTNGNGISGNPTVGLVSDAILPGTGAVTIPVGTTAQQPSSPQVGMMRYDTTVNAYYGYSAGLWRQFSLSGGVTQVDTGTGLTGGPITGTGTISIANTAVTAGSYGSSTQVGTFTVNAQGQLTAASNVSISAASIGAVTSITGTANEITVTGTTTVGLSLPSALTFTAKTVTGGAFNMTSATVGSDTVATLTANQTLTNKTISGSSNTLSNIANASLTNSSLTVGTTAISLGATSLTLGGLTSVAVTQDPTSALQLATKQYVDAVAQGLDPKASCVAATTVNITLSGVQTIDGIALVAGDRCLVKNQTAPADNGIYVVASGSWTRALDMDVWAEVPGAFTFIEQGTTQADTGWVCTSNAGGTIGTTAITWVQFAGVGSYTAGTGLTLTGTQFSITNTAVTAGAYGSATQVGTFTVNAQGQLTLAGNTTVTPAVGSITGLGTGVATALAVAVGTAGSFVINGGVLGTPSSGTLTNATGLPISTGVSGLGTNVATALGVAVGTAGAFVVNGGVLGTPSSGTLTNATGLPISTGVSGLGTGVATALAVNTGSTGAIVLYNGALGTPSSGTVTNLTGTASININGTVGATTPTTGAFTTVAATTVTATTGIFGGTF